MLGNTKMARFFRGIDTTAHTLHNQFDYTQDPASDDLLRRKPDVTDLRRYNLLDLTGNHPCRSAPVCQEIVCSQLVVG